MTLFNKSNAGQAAQKDPDARHATKNGVLEYWSTGVLILALLHHSTTPLLQLGEAIERNEADGAFSAACEVLT
jgi:hypothetical protein